MNVRKFHRWVGVAFAPFFLITAITGIILFWRNDDVYGEKTKDFLIGLHNWEIAAKYIGITLSIGLIFMTLTGVKKFFRSNRKKSQEDRTRKLTMSEIRQAFEENGYYHARAVFAPAEIAVMASEFDRIVDQLETTGEDTEVKFTGPEMEKIYSAEDTIMHTHNVHQFSGAWLRAIQQDRFLDITQEILGENIMLHHSKLFRKPALHGLPFPMHQDWSYFPTIKDTMIAAVIHVADATDAMGCLRVYPGSHRLGRQPDTSGQSEETAELLQDYPIENATILEAQAGDVVFFNYFTLHGSMPNRSDRVRKTVVVQMHAGDDHVEPGVDHPNEQMALRGWNFHASRLSANRS